MAMENVAFRLAGHLCLLETLRIENVGERLGTQLVQLLKK